MARQREALRLVVPPDFVALHIDRVGPDRRMAKVGPAVLARNLIRYPFSGRKVCRRGAWLQTGRNHYSY